MADWTEAKRDRLRRLWADPTRTVIEMGESLGKTPLAVSLEAQRLGLPSRYPNRAKEREPAK